MTLVSVIVPVYKVEDYLRKCVDSILLQTYKNLEIILVDDGSPDNCGAICDEYALLDGRVKVIHKENGGLSDARNAGLDVCTGEYIAFVDSDDWVDEDYIATFMEYAKSNAIVHCGFKRIYDKKEKVYCANRLYVLSNFDAVDNYQRGIVNYFSKFTDWKNDNIIEINNYMWNKLFHRNIFDNVRFPNGRVFEDAYVLLELLLRVDKVIIVPKATYNYWFRCDSICELPTKKSMFDFIVAQIKQENDVCSNEKFLINAKKITLGVYIIIYMDYLRGFYNLNDNELLSFRENIREYKQYITLKELKLFIKCVLILNCEIALKCLLKIWDIYKRLR